MPYSITTQDGITINNIPDEVAPDDQSLKDRVAQLRQQAAGSEAAQINAPAEAEKLGFFENVGEMITGTRRATPETETLPEWTSMPELNSMSMASFKTALGTMITNPEETVQVIQSNFPDAKVRQDAKGNYLITSSVDGKEYAIPPGLTVGDIPRVMGGLLAFTPAGRATTLPGAITAAGATQAAIEASQAGTGGTFDLGDIALSAAGGGLGQVVQTGVKAAVPVVKQAFQRVIGGQPAEQITQAAKTAAQAVPETVPPVTTPAAIPATKATAEAAEAAFEEVGTLARKAAGRGPGTTVAKEKLAELAQVNPEAKAAAERLGLDLPFDVFSDNPQVRAAVGLTRSQASSPAEAAWINTVRGAINRADEVIQQFDAAFIEGRPASGVASQNVLDSLKATQQTLEKDARQIYARVNEAIPKKTVGQFPKLTQTLDDVLEEVGEKGFTQQERRLYEMATDPDATYGRLMREKDLIGQAIDGMKSPYSSMVLGDLKRIYGALAEDQLSNVARVGGAELRKELRAANLITAKKKALEKRIVGAFGREIDGSIATLMQNAIKTASKGDAAKFNKLMKVVPEPLRKETIATALASATASGRSAQEGAFGFAEFAKTYRGLRANPPVYKTIVDTLGKESDAVMRDLYEISKRITDARGNVLTTGKSNQALVQGMTAETLIGKIMQTSMAQRAVTGVASAVPGGGVVAPDIVKFMSSGNTESIKKAGKLFASDEFQKLAIEAATKPQVTEQAIKKVALSKDFIDFAKSVYLPKTLDGRMEWLRSATQTVRQTEEQ